jgi:hypothetical protein
MSKFANFATAFSLVEMLIDLWGIEPIDPLQTVREWKDKALDYWNAAKRSPDDFLKENVTTPAEKKLRQALDYIHNRESALKDKDNKVAED